MRARISGVILALLGGLGCSSLQPGFRSLILVNGPDGWVISDVESPHDSLRMFLAQYRN